MKKRLIGLVMVGALLLSPMQALADVKVGDSIVTLGDALSETQQKDVLKYFNPGNDAKIISVNIAEERRYLGGVVPDAQIGNGTHSCAMVTYTKKGSGIDVKTHNINYVTDSAYESALVTAGVTDADVSVTAPFEVSGTGALTGIIKAYEVSSGKNVSEDVKQAATQELVTNTKLSEAVGEEKSSALINDIKKEVATERPQSDAEVRAIVDRVMKDNNITLTDAQYQELLNLIQQIANLDIDWGALANNLQQFTNQASDYLQSEEGQGLLAQVQDILNQFFDWVRDVFASQDKESKQ